MKKLIVFAVTTLFAFAVSAQTSAPVPVKAAPVEQPTKMESSKEAPVKNVVTDAKDEPMKKDAMKKGSIKKEEMTKKGPIKKDAMMKKNAAKKAEKKEGKSTKIEPIQVAD